MSAIGKLGKQPKKTMVIEPFDDIPKVSENFADDSWVKLEDALNAIITASRTNISREELYRLVNSICVQNLNEWLYERLVQKLQGWIREEIVRLNGIQGSDLDFLNQLDNKWSDFTSQVSTIRQIFLYLERAYMVNQKVNKTITDLAYNIFKANLIENQPVYARMINGALRMIYEERMQEMDHRILLKRIIMILQTLVIYRLDFEQKYIEETDKFYQDEGLDKINQLSVSDYLAYVEKRLKDESDRLNHYLDISTSKPTIQKLEIRLIKEKAEIVIEKGLLQLFEAYKVPDLQRLYVLFKRVECHSLIESGFEKVLLGKGNSIVQNNENRESVINELLELQSKVDVIQSQAFENNLKIKYANKRAWEQFMNSKPDIAQLLAKDLDEHLNKNSKIKMRDEEFSAHFTSIIDLFRHVTAKDIFEAFYCKKLAKRLLLDSSKSNEAEKSVIALLKAECGSTFTARIHNMYKDMELSHTLMESFNQTYGSQIERTGLSFHVWTLTGSVWPQVSQVKAILPPDLKSIQDLYTNFYTTNIKKKILTWQTSMSHCNLKAKFNSGIKNIQVSLHQALILLLFNDKNVCTMEDIMRATGLPEEEIKREIIPIVFKHKILLKNPAGKDINKTHQFSLNENFSSKLMRIKVNSLQIKETVQETHETIEKVLNERQYIIDAAIVRIMKSRKRLTHTQLISESLAQLPFTLQPVDIKKRIENLIERDYLSRDENDRSIYNYVS
ncbi:unnamed protein product [Blepharisma stoltei]|uniref:Cullin family profile domain-containing protein n=1 Tax=Blepharisma stoltei TaxID=1481888 RepID=A0AAU9JD43_9CILI|nr:unnamed protein product [Blepharisma stoltei]